MAALACSDCERPAECSCVCRFPLPLLCEEHRLSHATESHFPLPLDVLQHVRDNATQVELNGRVTNLRRLQSLLNLYSNSQQQPTIDIRDLLIQFYKDVGELKNKVAELKASSASREVKEEWILRGDVLSSLIWSTHASESELDTWMSIAHGLSLKGGFQYEESCRVLESHWKLVHSNKQVEVLVLNLILSEVMGLHIGRFEEALAILDQSLEIANVLYPKSEIALQLVNMKAAILIHLFEFSSGSDICNEALLSFGDAPMSEVSLGTTLYLYATDYLLQKRKPKSDGEANIMKWMLKTENSSSSLIEHIRLYLNASLKGGDENNISAGLVEAAEELAKRDFPTSIYAALSRFMSFHLRWQKKRESYFNLDEFLRIHFSKSLLRAFILGYKAEFFNSMGDKDKELEIRLLMHQLLQANPIRIGFYFNVEKLVKMHSADDQAVLDISESAYRIVFERSFNCLTSSMFLTSLSELYETLKLHEKKFEIYAEAVRKFQATDPTDHSFLQILEVLGRWEEDTQREKAIQMCIDSYQFLRQNCPLSENYFRAAKLMADIYMGLQQLEKVEEIFLEGFQIAKAFYKFRGCALFVDEVAADLILNYFSKEKKVAILDEIYDFLISIASPDCSDTACVIFKLFSDQPEKQLTILLAVYRTLLASPTNPALIEYLEALIKFYSETNQIEKEIETRLEVHQLLLNHDLCYRFFGNAKSLVICYWNQNQNDKAAQFQVQLCRHLIAHSESHQRMIDDLACYCRSKNRLDLLLENYTEVYRTLQPATNPQYNFIVRPLCLLHYEMGNHDTAVQIAQECMDSLTVLTEEGRDNLKLLEYLHSCSDHHERIIEICFNAISIYLENGNYREILNTFDSILEVLKRLKARYEVIEKLLGVAICLNNIGERETFKWALDLLHYFLHSERLENEEGIRHRKKILQHSWSICSRNMSTCNLLRQIGGYYWKVNEKEKAEACCFRAARVGSAPFICSHSDINKIYRSLYSGGQLSEY